MRRMGRARRGGLGPGGRAAAAVLALLVVGAGCGQAAKHAAVKAPPKAPPKAVTRVAPGGAPVLGGTITTAFSSGMPTLDPNAANDAESIAATQLMYEPLLTYRPTSAQLMAGLADKWTWSNGNKTLTVHLDPRARFADGTPVTASDVVFSFERMINPREKAPYATSFSDIVGYNGFVKGTATSLSGLVAVGGSTVRFELKTPQVFFLNLLALPSASIVEKSGVEAAKGGEFGNWWATQSFGSGPYVLDQWSQGQRLTLKANTGYWRKGEKTKGGIEFGPFAARVVFQLQVGGTQQVLEFKKGELDYLAEPVPSSQYLQILHSRQWRADYHSQPQDAVFYTGMNVQMAPFNKLAVRQAVADAIDKRRILQVLGNRGVIAGSILPPLMPGYDRALAPYPYDPARARKLLAQAGYDGATAKPIPYYVPDISVMEKSAAVVQQDLAAVGIRTVLRREKWDVFLKDASTPDTAPLVQLGWIQDYPDPQDFIYNLFNSASAVPGGNNASFYENKQLDHLEAVADADTNVATRLADYRQIQQIVHHDVPVVPEFYPTIDTLVQPWLDDQGHISLLLHPVMQAQLGKVWVRPHKGGA